MIKIATLVLLTTTAAMAEEFKITCIQQQDAIECAQPDGSIKRAQTIDPEQVEQSDRPAPGMWRPVERIQVSPPFETPKWVPNEETKRRALRRAYELNDNKMCCGSIDVSDDPVVTGRTVITPETEFNVLDAATKKKKN